MENKYEFKLAPAYCLFNGIVVMSQNGAEIKFLIENPDDEILVGRIKRAFCNFVDYVLRQEDCDDSFRTVPKFEFEKGDRILLRKYVSRLYGVNQQKINIDEKTHDDIEKEKRKQEAAAVLLLDTILFEGKTKGATDIHIEGNSIRLRVNGSLENYMDINQERKRELIQRIKLLAGMNSLEKRHSQDGHFVYGDEKPIFVRVSSVSVIGEKYDYEESVVLRLLDTGKLPLSIDFLGFNQLQIDKMHELCQLKNGLVLVAGPTCSGKSTTVAAMLVELIKMNYGKLKIISLEDPPEYVIPGVTQLKVEKNSDKSFTDSLDYIFRQDPDVIMIGEIRDNNSANAAIRASMTGHLVFATIHTSCAGEAVLRLENLGIGRKIVTSVTKAVIMQELSYRDGNGNLYGDIAIPNSDFNWIVNEEMSEKEIDEYFIHYTNYVESLSKELRNLGKSRKNKKQSHSIWRGEENDRQFHKGIV